VECPGGKPDFPRVTIDNEEVGRLGIAHLSALGLQDFAYVHESTRAYSRERLDAFRSGVLGAGGLFHQIDVPASSFPEAKRPSMIEDCMRESLLALPRPCGIMTKDDIAGVWTLRLLRKLRIDCPGEMPVLGVTDDIVFCHMTDPPLSSIPYPGRKIGMMAAELLQRMMLGEEIPTDHRVQILPPSVIARESTRFVTLPDSLVTRALEIIRRESQSRLVSVSGLCREVGVSRESLRQRFHATLGHSPKQEIERIRCLRVMDLLRNEADKTLEEIAEICGFCGADEICRFIKRHTGKTPGQIRRGNR